MMRKSTNDIVNISFDLSLLTTSFRIQADVSMDQSFTYRSNYNSPFNNNELRSSHTGFTIADFYRKNQHQQSFIDSGYLIDNHKTTKKLGTLQQKFLRTIDNQRKQKTRKKLMTNQNTIKQHKAEKVAINAKQLQQIQFYNKQLYQVFLQVIRAKNNALQTQHEIMKKYEEIINQEKIISEKKKKLANTCQSLQGQISNIKNALKQQSCLWPSKLMKNYC